MHDVKTKPQNQGEVLVWAPSAVFSGVALIALTLALNLPETCDRILPEEGHQQSLFTSHQQTEHYVDGKCAAEEKEETALDLTDPVVYKEWKKTNIKWCENDEKERRPSC